MSNDVLLMRCTQCGEMNRLPVVHCKNCGAKLDFEEAERRIGEINKPSVAMRVMQGVKLGVIVLLAALVLLAIWPSGLARTSGEAVDARRYRVKAELLVDAIQRGVPASQKITEAEANAYLKELVDSTRARGGQKAMLEDIGVRISNGRIEVLVAIARGPFTFTSLYRVEERDERLAVTGAKFGHLPLPGPAAELYAGTQESLMRQFKNESRILRYLHGVLIEEGEVEVLVQLGR